MVFCNEVYNQVLDSKKPETQNVLTHGGTDEETFHLKYQLIKNFFS